MCYSLADLNGLFRLKGKCRKTFDVIVSTNSVCFKFRCADLQPGRTPTPLGVLLVRLSFWQPVSDSYKT
jgi:hypothetical protein